MLSIGLAVVITGAVVFCIGFLIAIVVFGVRRYLSSGEIAKKDEQRNVEVGMPSVDEKQEMEWDNSALNIIVNPLDDLGDDLVAAVGDAEDDDASNFDSSDEETEMPRCKELEWDDSTLTF